MRRPLIGITCGPHHDDGVLFYGILPAYIKSITMAGGLPVLITPNTDEQVLRETYERMDGVLLAGGGDIDASYYGMENTELVGNIDRDRDFTEINVARWAADDNKPLFGICRGIQAINVALGGTLYQDVPTEYPGYNGIDHDTWGKAPRSHLSHGVSVKPETHLATVIGETAPEVNSMHHQAVRDVAPGLIISAHSPDGLIEGVELPGARFYVGVQWHPEELTDYSEPMRRLFAAFVKEAAK